MMGVAQTSEQSLKQSCKVGTVNTVEKEIYDLFLHHDNLSDGEINQLVAYPINYVTRARTDLLERGDIVFNINRSCWVTGRIVKTYRLCKGEKKKKEVVCLSHTAFNHLLKKVDLMNDFQKKKIIEHCGGGKSGINTKK